MTSKLYVRLRGVPFAVPAKPAGDLQPGDVILFNDGFRATVETVTRNKSGKTVRVNMVKDGRAYERQYTIRRLVGIAK